MSEIKFRAWDYDKMRYDVTGLKCNNGLVEGFYLDDIYAFGYIMQYTGLKDKNGKEIYEGDILRVHYYTDTYICEVCWSEENYWYIKYIQDECVEKIDKAFIENMEIIGNIFENPELLEE